MTNLQQLIAHRWRVPAEPFETSTADGVRIVGSRLRPRTEGSPTILLAHGYLGWHRKPRWARFAESLTKWFEVYLPDLRGHGSSGGRVDLGRSEIEDIDAVVGLARARGAATVVSAGASMGAVAAIRHAGLCGGVDCLVAISSLADWDWHDGGNPRNVRTLRFTWEHGAGRALTRAWGVRLGGEWPDLPETPEDVMGKVAPTPVLIVHGRNDHLFSLDQARRLYEAAGEPKRMLIGDRFGHAEDGLGSSFARRMSRAVYDLLEQQWSG
jgi:pimeloyl-ACP methyl ester carboxylesterase